jgi:AAHS family benzoate transporter-like MFS transporter
MTKNKKSKLVSVLNQVKGGGQYTFNDHYVLQEQLKSEMKGFLVKQLFKNGRTFSSLMFWVVFMCLFVMYGLST